MSLANTDPNPVKTELDTSWMYRGGVDPIAWMTNHADRIVLLHQKDFPGDAPQLLRLYDGVVSPTEIESGRTSREAFTIRFTGFSF